MSNPQNAAHPEAHKHTDPDAPHTRTARHTLTETEKPDQMAKKERKSEDRQEALIDEGVEETFPASDPVSVKRIT
jgi:hypothetical protein